MPVSPWMSTVASLWATEAAVSKTSSKALDEPIMFSNPYLRAIVLRKIRTSSISR